MNNLESYLDSTPDNELDIESYLLKDNLKLVSDFEGISNFLYSNNNQRIIGDFILASNKAINYIKQNREHKRNYIADYYATFKMFAKESSDIELDTFNKNFKYIHTISLDKNELSCKTKIINSIEELRFLGANDIDIKNSYYKLCDSQIITFKDLWPNTNEFDLINNKEYEKCLNKFLSSCNTTLDDMLHFLAYIDLDKDYNDVPLENRFLFPRVLSNCEMYSGNIIAIIDPSFYFIRKWISNRYQIKNKKIVFFINDKRLTQLLNSKLMFNSLFHFCEISELERIIENPKNIPSLSLIFANHLNHGMNFEKTINTLLEHITDKHRMMLFVPDKNVYKDSALYPIIRSSKIEKIDLLPRDIENSTSPQKKMILYIYYGYVEDKQLIEIKNYNLLKNNCRILSGNPFILRINKNIFVDSPDNIRQLFYQTDRSSQKKTDKERHPANLYLVSKEIAIEYTLSGEGTKENPFRGSAYALYPHHSKKKIRISKCDAEFKTLNEDKMFSWIEDDFLYLLKKNKNGEITNIRNIISEIYTKEYEKKSITFKTFVYIHSELENEFPDYYKNLIKEINNTYLADIPLNQISYDALLSFIEIDFKNRSCTKRQLINIMSAIFNTAIENKNCISNPASRILSESQKEIDELDDIRSALTQKFFYIEQIDEIIVYALKLINENIDIGLGVAILLRLFLGDEGNIISALKWKDVVLDQKIPYVFYQRQLSNDGTKYIPFINTHLSRKKPLVKFIYNILKGEKDRQLLKIANGDKKYLEECSVVYGTDYVIAGISRIYSPIKLNSSIRKLIKMVGLDEDLIYVPTNNGGTVETNLAYYSGDVFKSNYWHYLVKNNPNIKTGELFYLLGIKDQFDTDSNHYIDYSNNKSQLKLKKLQPTYGRDNNDI